MGKKILKGFLIFFIAFSSLFLLTSSTFALIYQHSTVYDVNKYFYSGVPIPPGVEPGGETSDNLMCWAAAASNVLMHTGWGFDRDSDGTIDIYDDIYHDFLADFNNVGGTGSMAYNHYVTDFWGSVLTANGQTWSTYFHQWNSDSTVFPTIDNYLANDYGIYLSITNDFGTLGHAITCWGYETDDATGDYTRILVTDSDRATGIGETHLQWYDLDYRSNRWYLNDYGTDVYIRRIDAYEANPYAVTAPVPEPASIFLMGSGLICLYGVVRRRKVK